MAAHSSVLAWRTPGTGEPGGLPSMGSHRVGHDYSDLAAAAPNFYSLKIKKISAGRLVLGDWLGCSRCLLGQASLPTWKSGSLLVMIEGFWQWLQRGSISFRGVLGSGPHFRGLATRPFTCGLGQDSVLCGRNWQPTPIFLPGKSHGQRSMVGYSPWGCKESDMT